MDPTICEEVHTRKDLKTVAITNYIYIEIMDDGASQQQQKFCPL